ncbi:hypothetical protein AHV09_00365 [Salmonella enterica subsp. enterica]|nr:hypothetical protein [Salmonella enterica subsp. enterica serovar Gombe]
MTRLPADELITLDLLPFFEWRGIRVMTLGMVDRLHKKSRRASAKLFNQYESEFTVGRDVYFLRSKDDLNAIPRGVPCRSGPELRLITESGYRILLRHLKDNSARNIRLSLKQSDPKYAVKPVEYENSILAQHSLPFFTWRGKRVMTLAMVDQLHGLDRGRSISVFCAHRREFVTGRDAFFISGAEAHDALPMGVDFYYGCSLWLITESGYLTLIRTMKNPQARKIRLSLLRSKHISADADMVPEAI